MRANRLLFRKRGLAHLSDTTGSRNSMADTSLPSVSGQSMRAGKKNGTTGRDGGGEAEAN